MNTSQTPPSNTLIKDLTKLSCALKTYISEYYHLEDFVLVTPEVKSALKTQIVSSSPPTTQVPPTEQILPPAPKVATPQNPKTLPIKKEPTSENKNDLGPADISAELEKLKKELMVEFPSKKWHTAPPPSPFTSSDELTLAPVMLFSSSNDSKEKGFLFALAKAITLSYYPTSVYSSDSLSEKTKAFISSTPHLKLAIFSNELTPFPVKGKSLSLLAFKEYFKSPDKKSELWMSVCQNLS